MAASVIQPKGTSLVNNAMIEKNVEYLDFDCDSGFVPRKPKRKALSASEIPARSSMFYAPSVNEFENTRKEKIKPAPVKRKKSQKDEEKSYVSYAAVRERTSPIPLRKSSRMPKTKIDKDFITWTESNECDVEQPLKKFKPSPEKKSVNSPPINSPVKISTINSPVKISTVNSPVKISTVNSPLRISTVNSPVKISTVNSPVKISTVNSPVKISTVNSSVKISTENATHVSDEPKLIANTTSNASTVLNKPQVVTIEDSDSSYIETPVKQPPKAQFVKDPLVPKKSRNLFVIDMTDQRISYKKNKQHQFGNVTSIECSLKKPSSSFRDLFSTKPKGKIADSFLQKIPSSALTANTNVKDSSRIANVNHSLNSEFVPPNNSTFHNSLSQISSVSSDNVSSLACKVPDKTFKTITTKPSLNTSSETSSNYSKSNNTPSESLLVNTEPRCIETNHDVVQKCNNLEVNGAGTQSNSDNTEIKSVGLEQQPYVTKSKKRKSSPRTMKKVDDDTPIDDFKKRIQIDKQSKLIGKKDKKSKAARVFGIKKDTKKAKGVKINDDESKRKSALVPKKLESSSMTNAILEKSKTGARNEENIVTDEGNTSLASIISCTSPLSGGKSNGISRCAGNSKFGKKLIDKISKTIGDKTLKNKLKKNKSKTVQTPDKQKEKNDTKDISCSKNSDISTPNYNQNFNSKNKMNQNEIIDSSMDTNSGFTDTYYVIKDGQMVAIKLLKDEIVNEPIGNYKIPTNKLNFTLENSVEMNASNSSIVCLDTSFDQKPLCGSAVEEEKSKIESSRNEKLEDEDRNSGTESTDDSETDEDALEEEKLNDSQLQRQKIEEKIQLALNGSENSNENVIMLKCSLCDFSNTDRDLFAEHLLNHRTNEDCDASNETSDETTVNSDTNKSPYQRQWKHCPYCEYKSLYGYNLSRHKARIHFAHKKSKDSTLTSDANTEDETERNEFVALKDEKSTDSEMVDKHELKFESNTQQSDSDVNVKKEEEENQIIDEDAAIEDEVRVNEPLVKLETDNPDPENSSDFNEHKCPFCPYFTTSRDDLIEHINYIHVLTERNYVCDACEFNTFDKSEFIKHQNHHQGIFTGPETLVCPLCKMPFKQEERSEFFEHIRYHTIAVKEYACTLCKYTTPYASTIAKHKQNHEEKQIWKCDVEGCDFSTFDARTIKTHNFSHSDEPRYKCQFCEFTTSLNREMKNHNSTHGKDLHKCTYCDYETLYRKDFTAHNKLHKNKYLRRCTFCTFCTLRKPHLLDHVLKVHENPEDVAERSCAS